MVRKLAALVAIVLVAAALPSASAQRPLGTAPSRGPGWLPRRSQLFPGTPYSPAEMTEVLARLEAINRIVVKSGVFDNPEGYEIEPRFHPGGDADLNADGTPKRRATVLGYAYALRMYAPTKKVAGEGTECVRIYVNAAPGASKLPYNNRAGDMFMEWDHGDPIPGATSVWNHLSPTARSFVEVLFTSGGAEYWKPVTRGDFLDAVLVQMQGDPQKIAAAKAAVDETPYRRWIAAAADRKQMRDVIVAALPASQAAARRKQMEDDDRKTTEELRASEAKDSAGLAKELTAMDKPLESLRAKIAATSPAERRIPAWLDRHAVQDAFPLVAPRSDTAVRVLQFDSDFVRARRSRVEARTIYVHLSASLSCEMPAIHGAVYKALSQLDWAAFARLVEP
jgi:hypothetical protein